MTSRFTLAFTSIMRQNKARLAHHDMDHFLTSLKSMEAQWVNLHGRRATFNWDAIVDKMTEAMAEIVDERQLGQISSHDLLALHEKLNRDYRTSDNSVTCSDACQVALDMAIKAQHAPTPKQTAELVA